ncbi:hypothetical protein ACEPAH_9363 [Sanghuangporus vaninii]
MNSLTKVLIIASAASLAIATPAPQLGDLPSLPVCLTGDLTSVLPAGLDLVACSAGEACTDPSVILASIPILGSILGGILSELPAGVGVSIWNVRKGGRATENLVFSPPSSAHDAENTFGFQIRSFKMLCDLYVLSLYALWDASTNFVLAQD